MNNHEHLLNSYNNRAFPMNDFNVLTQVDLLPNMNTGTNFNTNSNSTKFQLYTPQEAYDKGNLFANLYQSYKNYQPVTLIARNERERLFLELSRMSFAAHELNLYLDNFPDDSSMLRLFNDYREKANQLRNEYQQKYDVITINGNISNSTPFAWENEKWPWEGGI